MSGHIWRKVDLLFERSLSLRVSIRCTEIHRFCPETCLAPLLCTICNPTVGAPSSPLSPPLDSRRHTGLRSDEARELSAWGVRTWPWVLERVVREAGSRVFWDPRCASFRTFSSSRPEPAKGPLGTGGQ